MAMARAMIVVLTLLVIGAFGASPHKAAPPALKIIQDSLHRDGDFYFVKGTVYNPHDKAVKNVVIKYYIWKKWMGKDDHGTRIRDTGGLVTATIKYIPPKQSVDFTATGNDAAVAATELPDPLNAEISAEWDQ